MDSIYKEYKNLLTTILLKYGEILPKKHGSWRKLHVYDNHYLILDEWNLSISHYINPTDSGISNLYKVIYNFTGKQNPIKQHMYAFRYAHLTNLN